MVSTEYLAVQIKVYGAVRFFPGLHRNVDKAAKRTAIAGHVNNR